ncbi:MAG TPA: hypothetical protein VMM77_02200, partial [Gemmatimonadaceae bacterium]|nr:hypothetical protein [Gemmatimonadaceae bacterium]
EAGIAHTSALVDDANGTSVSYALAPAIGAGMAWTLSAGTNALLGARLSRAGVRIDYGSDDRSAGSGWVVDVRAMLEREVSGCASGPSRGCTALNAGVGALWAGGPDDVAPFTVDRGALLNGEIGASVRVMAARPVYLTLAAQAFRIGGATAGDPVRESGTVMRVMVGGRHGR